VTQQRFPNIATTIKSLLSAHSEQFKAVLTIKVFPRTTIGEQYPFAAKDDLKSVVYLCCPVQSEETWAFLTAVTTFQKGDWDGRETTRLLPVRQLDFNDRETAQIFEETHNLANWVVNYDELLDRRQLQNQASESFATSSPRRKDATW